MHYLFKQESLLSEESVINFLLEKGFEHPYTVEEENNTYIGAFHLEDINTQYFPLDLVKKESSHIDWQQEWQLHAKNTLDNGSMPLLLPNGQTLYLLPGAGFGDASHPTTTLCLKKLAESINGQTVIDLGSGSGILALSARLLGAPIAIGLEIDLSAIIHSKNNREYNHIEHVDFVTQLPHLEQKNLLMVMNMISSEQNQLFVQQDIAYLTGTWIISGILQKEEEAYLLQAKKRNWQLLDKEYSGEWSVYVFTS